MSSIIELSDIDDYNEKDLIKMRENNSDSENELESEETLAFFTSQLRVPKVIYTTVPIEYPDTSSEGVATVYNVTGWKNHTDAFSDIQYSTNGSGGTTNIQECPFFGGIPVKKNQRKCQGIKFCQFTDPELVNQEHCSVDFDSEIFQHYTQQNNNNTKEAKTYTLFLAAKDTPCNFKKDNIPCNGGPHIGRITNYQTNIVSYFIGCNKYKQGDKWHRYIKIKQDEVDISLLQSLFTGSASCSMILSKSCKRKKCDMPHTHNGTIVPLVCVGTHNHPPPAPERIPSGIKNNLESLITQAIQQDDNVTSRSILSGNLLSAYFNKETLAEVHVSLNNIDKLRYLVGKAYKTLHPFRQGVIGIYHNILNPKSDLINYVRKIDLYSNNGQVIITCMLDNQAKKLITLDYFQIDVSFKRVKGEINEFEINTYDSKHHPEILSFCRIFTNVFTAEGYHRLFSSLFQIIREVSGQSIQFRHIHGSGIGCILADLDAAQAKGLGLALHDLDHEKSWETHLTFILKTCLVHFERNLFHKTFTISTKNLIRQIPNATSKEQVHDLLQQIEDTNDEGIKEWLNYYRQSYVLSSLNKYVSNVDHEIWNKSGSDTNNAEAAHSMANREGKQLKLLSAILKGKRYDARCYTTIEVHDKNGVPYTHRDKSDVKRLQNSIVRSSRIQKNKVSLNNKLPKSSKKRKLSPSNSRTPIRSKENHERTENILSDNEEETFSKEIHKKNLKLELKEKEIILREREIKARVAEAEARMMEAKAEALEIENQQKR
ncbi:uncharacterized protein OCT59_005591 [Rhizophagus irregularis]|uniref:uncharacterized protein n=1 Tax=Rhizophagus irregularis TaxID=588596 RepID=UPI0033330D0D|nr:hypothetical protein OCT59_005591 [Rhizophagus irregularis]